MEDDRITLQVIELDIGTSQGNSNNFIGYRAGYLNTAGQQNNFIGYYAGYNNAKAGVTGGNFNNFIGVRAGYFNTKGSLNNFIGHQAGYSNTEGSYNNFLGYQAGYLNTKGSYNNFLGYQAGYNNAAGVTLIGNQGKYNNFIGGNAGYFNTKGYYNIFLGYRAGYLTTTGHSNNFIGSYAGFKNTTGEKNVFIGYRAGYYITTGKNNIIIGPEITTSPEGYVEGGDNQFVLGYKDGEAWLTGTIGTDELKINFEKADGTKMSKKVCIEGGEGSGGTCAPGAFPPSSKTLKKEIKSFTNYRSSLKDIIDTPLYTYQYKESTHLHQKERMGIISEELPHHLQINVKGEVSKPDWVSIYGTLWASIKALVIQIKDVRNTFFEFKQHSFEKFQLIFNDITKLKNKIKDLFDFKSETKEILKAQMEENKNLKEELNLIKQKILNIEKTLNE